MDKLGRNKVLIDVAGHPAEVFVDGEKYHLLCEYDSRLVAGLVSVYLKDEGTDVVVAFPRAGLGFVGKFSVASDKLEDLFHYIEATLSLKAKDGFDVYCEDLKDLLTTAEGAGKKFPIIHHGIEPAQSWFAKTYNRVYQDRLLSKEGWFDSEHLVETDFDVSLGQEGLELPDALTTDETEELRSVVSEAKGLPVGWRWVCYQDGSGHLEGPNGESRFSYDRNTSFAASGGIEYEKTPDSDWEVFWGTFVEFQGHAEDVLGRELSCVGKYDVRRIMGQVADNAWYGKEPTTVCLAAGEYLITIDGYTYEPSYESFSSTASIALNGEILYGQDSRCVEAYRYEVYQTGQFGSLEEAVAHIADTVKGNAVVLVEEASQVEELIAAAGARCEQTSGNAAKTVEHTIE